jgi:hypothetical protein
MESYGAIFGVAGLLLAIASQLCGAVSLGSRNFGKGVLCLFIPFFYLAAGRESKFYNLIVSAQIIGACLTVIGLRLYIGD